MSQSLSKLYIHLVFSTKGRTETLPKQHLSEIHAYVAEILNQNHCPAICVGGTANHIHILFILNKTMSLSDTIRIVKTSSSKWINEKNGKYNPFCWQDGYGAFSISQSHVDAVMHYIETQAEHHAKTSYMDEFRRLCEIYDVALDERYAWD
jgi:REP element-mobilizing transposase RayT